MTNKYTIYVDESGDANLRSGRWLCLCGIILEDDYARSNVVYQFDEFKKKIHEYDYSGEKHSVGYTMKDRKYAELVYSDTTKIDMIDPSVGPYMHSDYDMGMFDESFKGMVIDYFESDPKGYLIKIKSHDNV
jgi:hypothetical protein